MATLASAPVSGCVINVDDSNLANRVVEPIGKNVVFGHQVLDFAAGFIAKGLIASDMRMSCELANERHHFFLPALR